MSHIQYGIMDNTLCIHNKYNLRGKSMQKRGTIYIAVSSIKQTNNFLTKCFLFPLCRRGQTKWC